MSECTFGVGSQKPGMTLFVPFCIFNTLYIIFGYIYCTVGTNYKTSYCCCKIMMAMMMIKWRMLLPVN